MSSKHRQVIVWGLFLALSTILLITPLGAQATNRRSNSTHLPLRNALANTLPPNGSIYAIHVVGAAHILGKDKVKPSNAYTGFKVDSAKTTDRDKVKPVIADMEFKVVSVKTTGIPSSYLELTSGKLRLGDNIYVLSKGAATIQVNRINIRASTEDGTKILTIFGEIAEPLPVSVTENPVDLSPAIHHKSADIQVGVESWVLSFSGKISRIS